MKTQENLIARKVVGKLYLAVLMFTITLLCINLASAFEFDNIKNYNPVDRSIVVTNAFNLGADIAKITPLTPHNNYVISGKDRLVAEFNIESYGEYTEGVWDAMTFYDLNKNNKVITRNFKIKYVERVDTETRQNYKQVCTEIDKEKNITTCEQVKDNIIEIKKNVWADLDTNTNLKEGTIHIGIFADVNSRDYVEFIPTWFGKEMPEYATWTDAMNIGLTHYWTMNESSGDTIAKDIVGGGTYGEKNITLIPNTNFKGGGLFGNKLNGTGAPGAYAITQNADAGFPNGTAEFTVSIWFRNKNAVSGGLFSINSPTGATIGIYCNTNNGDGGTRCFMNGVDTAVQATNFDNTGAAWNHLVITRNSSQGLNMYANGSLIYMRSTSATIIAGNLSLFQKEGDAAYIKADADELAFWNRSLTDAEITDLYNSGDGITYAPTILLATTLNSPVNAYSSVNKTITFNCSAVTPATSLVNITLWTNQSGTLERNLTQSVTGTSNTSIFQQTFAYGNYNWTCSSCDSDNDCAISGSSRNLTTTLYSVNGITYTTPVTETSLNTFILNFSYSSETILSTSNFVYNNTQYTPTITTIGNNNYLTNVITAPSVNTKTNKSFFWTVNLASGEQINTTWNNQTINPIGFGICNETLNITLVNFTIKDATTPFPIINATFKSTWLIGESGSTKSYSYQDMGQENSSFAFCNYAATSLTTNLVVEYGRTGYGSNFYYLVNETLTSGSHNVSLYLLNDTLATTTVLKVRDTSQAPIPNIVIKIQAYDPGTGNYSTVGMARTDYNGEDVAYLNWYDTLYKFILYQNGVIISTIDGTKITATPKVFTISSTGDVSVFDKFEDMTHSLNFVNASNSFVLTFTKTNAAIETGCLRVFKRTTYNDTEICLTCETANSATITCDITGYGNGTYIGVFYATGSWLLVDWLAFHFGGNFAESIYSELGNADGTFYALMFAGISMAMMFISPVLAIIGLILGLAGGFALGFQLIDYGTFGIITIIGGIVIWLMKR